MPYASPKTRKKVKQQIKQQSSRRGLYILGMIILLIAIGVGYYVYASTQSGASPPSSSTSTQGTNGIVYAKINTSQGTIVVELYRNSAPKTVDNFVNLSNSGFYNNLVWHRLAKNPNVIQTGDPNTRNAGGDRTTWGQGGSSQTVPLEIDSSLHNNVGYLGMARSSDPNSGSSQFYINLANNNSLDGSYTVFGKIISGMNVAIALGNLPTSSQYPEQPADPSSAMLLGVTISNTP